jgi:hypothetical protein
MWGGLCDCLVRRHQGSIPRSIISQDPILSDEADIRGTDVDLALERIEGVAEFMKQRFAA